MKKRKRKKALESVIVENNPLEHELLKDLKDIKKEQRARKKRPTPTS